MNDLFLHSATAGVILSVAAYQIGTVLKKKYKSAFLNPILIAVAIIILFITAFHVEYESYMKSASFIGWFLTPATVCLALPLYRQMSLLRRHYAAILIGVFAGVLTSTLSIFAMALLFGLSHAEYVTMLPKSITTAIGMGVSEELGGFSTISAAVIIVTGIIGNMTAEPFCRFLAIRNPIAKGLAIGTASHAIGTAKAMELGEIEGAMSSLAIALAGLMTVGAAVLFAGFL